MLRKKSKKYSDTDGVETSSDAAQPITTQTIVVEEKPSKWDTAKEIIFWPLRVIGWTLLIGSFAIIAIAVVIPRIAGATPYTVLTGSMEPKYPPGTMVVDRPADPDKIKPGDVVTYQLESGQPEVVTHRVVSVSTTLQGDYLFQTQGDANNAPDAKLVKPVQIRGKMWYHIPYLGYVAEFISPKHKENATYIIAGVLVLYALWMFLGSFFEKRRKKRQRIIEVEVPATNPPVATVTEEKPAATPSSDTTTNGNSEDPTAEAYRGKRVSAGEPEKPEAS